MIRALFFILLLIHCTLAQNKMQSKTWLTLDVTQSIHSRTHLFDGALPISSVEDVIELKPPHFWLNVEYASFYAQHKLDPASYVEKALRTKLINYISSPEITCLAHNKNATRPSKGPLIISRNGASGTYPGCTDLAYEQAINDGADIIDCSVQMSKDGVPFCLDSVDLCGETNALSAFLSRSTKIPEIQQENGIFSFDLTWSEIQTLKPQVTNPFQQSGMKTNPVNNDKGRFVTLSAFLELARTKAVTGILINIQNAAYLASQKGISITDIVTSALSNATIDKQHTQKVLIQSDDTQVLSKFTENPNYQKVLFINETISAAPKMTVDEIKKHADAVSVPRSSIVKSSNYFATAFTSVVDDMHAANVSVYAFPFRNEFVNMEFDYFADPMVELATYTALLRVDGVITEFPATANAYLSKTLS
ncbi:SHV3-like 4 [Actinidia rufa]|uniref:glycerophosphodiester phosphodiesterase n=1 Tax=Actinidia rufa TaxID=165716 RepID=A0A7J0FM31_9ERIC|nr:SHV3-like 4 [Actinidia rufa]